MKCHVGLLGFCLLVSCAKSHVEALNKRLDSYWNGMRWQSLGSISSMVEESQRLEFMQKLSQELAKHRIVDYSLVGMQLSPDQKQATTTVQYSYYHLETNALRSAQIKQEWHYHAKGGWQLRLPAKP